MIEVARRLLGIRKPARVYVPLDRPSLMLRRVADQWLVVMLHGGEEIARYTPKQARRMANQFVEMAWLASNPGECPTGIHQ